MGDTDAIEQQGRLLFEEYCSLIGYKSWQQRDEFEFQLHCGDYTVTTTRRTINAEVKAEQTSTGRLYVEIWSNKRIGRRGWLYNLDQCDFLFYGFLNLQILCIVDFRKLRQFDLSAWPELLQYKNEQANDTYGVPVPISNLLEAGVIVKKVYMNEFRKEKSR